MKKLSVLLLAILLVACQSTPSQSEYNILVPTGAPAISTIPFLKDERHEVELVSGAENLQAALVSENSAYDAIIAPLNLGAALLAQDKTSYKLHSIVTWGNLFLVAKNQEPKTLALFGEMAVVGLVFKDIEDQLNFEYEGQWLPSVSEAQALLLSDRVEGALLAQPLVAATLAKAKESDLELSVIADIQQLYSQKYGVDSYPQAALFVASDLSKEEADDIALQMSTYTSQIKDNKETFVGDVESITSEKLGIPSGELVYNVFDQMGINVVSAKDKLTEINQFLELFNLAISLDNIIQ